jgi:hypothetical protein
LTHRKGLEEDQALDDALHGVAAEAELSTEMFVFGAATQEAREDGSFRRQSEVGAAGERGDAARRRAHFSFGFVGTGGDAGGAVQRRQARRRVDQALQRVHFAEVCHVCATPGGLGHHHCTRTSDH